MIETKDLILRCGTEMDGPDLYRNLWSRPESFRYLFSRPSPDEEAGLRRTAAYAEMHRQVDTEFFVWEKASGQTIGIAGVKELAPGRWTITDVAIGPDFQGQGYGKQAVGALTELAFSHGAAQVCYDCFARNEASRRLALSCGFSYSGSKEAELKKDGETVRLDHYSITK